MSPIRHLTDEQLGAHADGALAGAKRAEAERHLADCAACRARLAELVADDQALGQALAHDPGEAYFATFAGRVSERIARGPQAGAPAAAPRPWWSSPRALAWAGSALGLCVVAALVVVMARTHGPEELAARAAKREAGEHRAAPPVAAAPNGTERSAAPAERGASDEAAKRSAPAPQRSLTAGAPATSARRDERADDARARGAGAHASDRLGAREQGGANAPTPAPRVEVAPQAETALPPPAPAAPARLMEVKTLPNGEQVAVHHEGEPAPLATPRVVRTPSGALKPGAQPMALQAPVPVGAEKSGYRALDQAQAIAAKSVPAPATLGGAAPVREESNATAAAAWQLCGTIVDDHARPVAGAAVTNVATGAGAVTGADGAFCVPATEAKLSVSILAIGFRGQRLAATREHAGRPANIRLAAVETLAGGLGARASGAADSAARVALAATEQARGRNTGAAWRLAADAWGHALELARDRSVEAVRDARFHLAEASVNAWRIEHGETARNTALANVDAYLAVAPAGPLRTLAEGWRKELAQ